MRPLGPTPNKSTHYLLDYGDYNYQLADLNSIERIKEALGIKKNLPEILAM